MAANEVAALATEAMPYITAAVGAYGGAVLAETRDKAANATVGAGARILQRLFGHEKPGGPLPEPLADVVAHPGDGKFLAALTAAVREALEQDAAMLADVRALVPRSPGTVVTQNVSAGRDAYSSVAPRRDAYVTGRDLNIHVHEAAPTLSTPVRLWGNVPARNPAFTGREEQLDDINSALVSGSRSAIQALHGIGGIGKTQLAVEYAHRFSSDYDIVWWLNTENTALFTQQYADLAVALRCSEPGASQDQVRRAVLSDLHHRQRWLIIFDNAEDPGYLRDWLPSGPGHVLITSRRAGWDEVAVPVPVNVLTRPESVRLLQSRVPSLSDSDATTLAEALGDLPLALAQAAAYLAETRLPPIEFLRLLLARPADLLATGVPTTYGATLTSVTTLAYDRLWHADAAVADLAAICAFLAPEPIPVQWLTAAASQLPGRLGTRLADPLQQRQLLATLAQTSLARIDDDGITMHRLIQAILRAYAGSHGFARVCAETIVISNRPLGNGDNPASWPAWARLLPHLLALDPAYTENRDLTEATIQAASRLIASEDLNLRRVTQYAASYVIAASQPTYACVLARQLHRQWRDHLGPDSPQTLSIADYLGHALWVVGRYDEARKIHDDTLARRRRVLGADHPDTLTSAYHLANTRHVLRDYHAARSLQKDTLERRRRALGADHPDTLKSADSLAATLRELGDHQAACAIAEDTLERRRQLRGEDYPDT